MNDPRPTQSQTETVQTVQGFTTELVASQDGPECYVRVNVAKNSKGYSHETTVSVRWSTATDSAPFGHDHLVEIPELGDDGEVSDRMTIKTLDQVVAELLTAADTAARVEIGRREDLDAGGAS